MLRRSHDDRRELRWAALSPVSCSEARRLVTALLSAEHINDHTGRRNDRLRHDDLRRRLLIDHEAKQRAASLDMVGDSIREPRVTRSMDCGQGEPRSPPATVIAKSP